MQKVHHTKHVPVMLAEVLQYLAPEKGQTLLDATAGYGGHAHSILEQTGQYDGSVLVDRDKHAIDDLAKRFDSKPVRIIHDDFAHASLELSQADSHFNIILADLGVSSPHLDNASRGFSFMTDGPLDMRMDSSKGLTAADLVNTSSEEALTDILSTYGEEPRARRVAKALVAARPLQTTSELVQVLLDVYGGRGKYKTHPATKTFQALRIAVNDELAQVRYALPLWVKMLKPGGRLGVISFHSLEDRIVKDTFKDLGGDRYDAELTIITKKPILASSNEIVSNPRSRSAKLRVVVKK